MAPHVIAAAATATTATAAAACCWVRLGEQQNNVYHALGKRDGREEDRKKSEKLACTDYILFLCTTIIIYSLFGQGYATNYKNYVD